MGNHMRPLTINECFKNFSIWKILKTQVQLILNCMRTCGIKCLSLFIFIWEACLASQQIINQPELTS